MAQQPKKKPEKGTLSRKQAEKRVAATTDPAVLETLSKHPNKHVKHKATHKLARLNPS